MSTVTRQAFKQRHIQAVQTAVRARSLPTLRIRDRIVACWRTKLLFTIVFLLWCQGPYFLCQRYTFFPTTVMPITAVDRLVPFVPIAVWPYLGIYPVGVMILLMMVNNRYLWRMIQGVSFIALVSSLSFFFFPTIVPRPPYGNVHFLYVLLRKHVTPLCACPSLHASLVTFFTLWGIHVLREEGKGRWRGWLWAWWFVVLLATLLTKQHVVPDLLAGGSLGGVAYLGLQLLDRAPQRKKAV
jgi:hypothetical protein